MLSSAPFTITSPSPLPYHREVVAYLQEFECELWRWASSAESRAGEADDVRTAMLKTHYRLDADAHSQLTERCAAMAARLGVAAPVTMYQARAGLRMNAALIHLPGEAHLVFTGPILEKLDFNIEGADEPFIYRDFETGKMYLVQNVKGGELQRAVGACTDWYSYGINPGNGVPPSPLQLSDLPHVIYGISTSVRVADAKPACLPSLFIRFTCLNFIDGPARSIFLIYSSRLSFAKPSHDGSSMP